MSELGLLPSLLLAYLIGSVPFAVVISRLFALPSPTSYGSHNPGATNVLRSGHKLAAALTLVLDALKGTLAVLLLPQHAAAVALVAVIGHVFPLWLSFRGGKGVATALGVMAALHWPLALAVALSWLAVLAWKKTSSLAAIVACLSAPLWSFYLLDNGAYRTAVVVIALLVLARHRDNIHRLMAGTEQ